MSDLDLSDDLPVWVGVDMALKHDSIAVVIAQPQDDTVVVRAQIWMPRDEGVDVATVEQHLRDLHRRFEVREFAYDPAFFQRSAEALADDGLPMVEYPQTAARMIPACATTYQMIVGGRIAHDATPTFTDQVLSATQRVTDHGWRLSKGKSRRRIDAAIGLVMAVDRATSRAVAPAGPTIINPWL